MNEIQNSMTNCWIKPLPPNRASSSDFDGRADYHGCLGSIIWIFSCILGFIVLSIIDSKKPWWLMLSPLIFATIATAYSIMALREKRAKKEINEQNLRYEQQSDRNAKTEAKRAVSRYESSLEKLSDAKFSMNETIKAIEQAKYEFGQNAYSPFWDKVQESILKLSDSNEIIKSISLDAQEYANILKGREHNFPQFPVTTEILPDIRGVSQDLYQVIRMGQTNFEFSLIYEQRKTREVLIAGFKSLEDAIDRFRASINESFKDATAQIKTAIYETISR